MHINELPNEVLFQILLEAVKLNERNGVTYTFGLSQPPMPPGQILKRPQRYVRGPVPPALLRMDSTQSVRCVCSKWHDWAIAYALKDIYIRCWRGSERWCDISLRRDKYDLYELIEYPRGERVYRDPYATLNLTKRLVEDFPGVASNVRRIWFDGLYVPETDASILATVKSCENLTFASLPWTTLRHGTASEWAALLGNHRAQPLRSLEFLSINLSQKQHEAACKMTDQRPLDSYKVNFQNLRRLKLFGDTTFLAINDADLKAIARTATGLEELQVTCISTVTIEGVMALVRSSQKTLRILEHAPRSMDGFWHSHPGSMTDNEHLCSLLTRCPKLEDLSISLPSVCSELFAADKRLRWRGDCQVRALHLCGHEHSNPIRDHARITHSLRDLLSAARNLSRTQASSMFPVELNVELFYADCIFEPHVSAVHGDFQLAEEVSNGAWPSPWEKSVSGKGPYGNTGLYEKNDKDTAFMRIGEAEFFRGVDAGWATVA